MSEISLTLDRRGRRMTMPTLLTCAAVLSAGAAHATDEIQVYNAGIASVGQLTIQQHLNYVSLGQTKPTFPGGLASDRSLNGTPEFAYGLTDWWEVGLYLPFAVQDDRFYSNSVKLRTLFVVPNANDRTLFYGVNFEFSNFTPKFSQTRFGMEIRPIIGLRRGEWEFIVNPIVDIGFGRYGQTTFAPAARVARKVDSDLYLGLEYYSDLGEFRRFSSFKNQQHTLFAVSDFKLGILNVNLGVGVGLTPSSDRVVVKTIVGYAFPVPGGKTDANERSPVAFSNPMGRNSSGRSAPYQ